MYVRVSDFGPETVQVKRLPGNCAIVRQSVSLLSIIFPFRQKAVWHSYEAPNNGPLCPLLWYTVMITISRWIGLGVLVIEFGAQCALTSAVKNRSHISVEELTNNEVRLLSQCFIG